MVKTAEEVTANRAANIKTRKTSQKREKESEQGIAKPKVAIDPKFIEKHFKQDEMPPVFWSRKIWTQKLQRALRIYPSEKVRNDDKDYNTWVKHPLKGFYSEDAKLRYEIFCGGWLQFFDDEVKNGQAPIMPFISNGHRNGLQS